MYQLVGRNDAQLGCCHRRGGGGGGGRDAPCHWASAWARARRGRRARRRDWSVDDVCDFLSSGKLESHAPRFPAEQVDGPLLEECVKEKLGKLYYRILFNKKYTPPTIETPSPDAQPCSTSSC